MFNEDNTVEQMLIEAATQSGWQYVKSQDIPRSSDSVLVESWLLEALIRRSKLFINSVLLLLVEVIMMNW